MLRSELIIIPLFLVGCATNDKVEIKTQIVEIPVPIFCKTPEPPIPTFNFESIKESDNIFDKVKALLADRNISKSYELELAAALKSCK